MVESIAASIADDASLDDVDERVGEHREEEVHDQEQPPEGHALGGDVHDASTRAAINALVEDADLESEQGAQGRVNAHTATEVHDEPQPPAGKGEPDGVAELDDTGTLRQGQVPSLAISNTFTVATEDDLTTLTDAEVGDVAIATEPSQSYILTGDPTVRDDWVAFQSPPAPVQDVFGRTGSVDPESGDYTAAQIDNFNATAADAAPVQEVNEQTGSVDLGAADVGAEPEGSVEDHRTTETHTTAQPPEEHGDTEHDDTVPSQSDVDGKADDPHGSESHSSDVVHEGEDAAFGETAHDSVNTEDLGIGTGEQSEDDLVFSLEDSGTVVGWTAEGDVLGRNLALEERNETTNWRLFYDENRQSTSRNDWNPFQMDGKDFGNSEGAWDDTDFKFTAPYDGVYQVSYVLNVNFTNADGTWNTVNARIELNGQLLAARLRTNYEREELDSFSDLDNTIALTGYTSYNLNEGDELQPFFRNRMADEEDVFVSGGTGSQLSITFVGGGG